MKYKVFTQRKINPFVICSFANKCIDQSGILKSNCVTSFQINSICFRFKQQDHKSVIQDSSMKNLTTGYNAQSWKYLFEDSRVLHRFNQVITYNLN